MTLLIGIAALTIIASFLCSTLEAALLSLSPSYVKTLITTRPRVGRMLDQMKERIDRPLAAILTFNTIANTAGAVCVGAQAEKVFGDRAIGIASAVLTLLILVVSEIIPKTLGAVHAKSLAGFTAWVTRAMMIGGLPLLVGLERLSRVFGSGGQADLIGRAELIAAIGIGRRHGALEAGEFHIIQNVLAMHQVPLSSVMTPRTVVFSLPQHLTVRQTMSEHEPIRFARFPVYGESRDDIRGYVARFHIYERNAAGESDMTLGDLARPVPFLPRQASVAAAMDRMLRAQQHIAVVVDEHGGTDGVITLEDAVEAMLGHEIIDETDTVADMRKLARRKGRRLPGSKSRQRESDNQP